MHLNIKKNLIRLFFFLEKKLLLNNTQKKIYNEGERLIPGVTHDMLEVVRHKTSYDFFRAIIDDDIASHKKLSAQKKVTISDFGFGVGHGCYSLSRIRNCQITGVDISEDCKNYAEKHYSAKNIKYQAIDLASVGLALNEQQLREMHRLKTGALLSASVMMGAACGNISAQTWSCLERYGQAMGLAFQVVDDVLDVTADSVTLGKTAGKDAANDKPTYVSLLGLAQAQKYAEQLLHEALKALEDSGLKSAHSLAALAQRVVNRKT